MLWKEGDGGEGEELEEEGEAVRLGDGTREDDDGGAAGGGGGGGGAGGGGGRSVEVCQCI